MTSLKLKKGFVLGIASWLTELNLTGKQSRERTRFVKVLSDEYAAIDKERQEIIGKYVEKEEDGTTWKKTVDNSSGKEVEGWDLTPANLTLANDEINTLFQEDFVLDVTEANKERIAIIKDIILNTDYRFGPKEGDSIEEKIAKIRQAADYEMWCEAFETVEIQ